MLVAMVVITVVIMAVVVVIVAAIRVMGMIVPVRRSFDPGILAAATAGIAHRRSLHSTSSSRTRISVPPVTCTW
ncbi:putative uncharacterized protein [Burkholderiales bacterium GJ-E10]|nr:putative uncharacterized protein [Burkholderiales bacterium GJ-E10]